MVIEFLQEKKRQEKREKERRVLVPLSEESRGQREEEAKMKKGRGEPGTSTKVKNIAGRA